MFHWENVIGHFFCFSNWSFWMKFPPEWRAHRVIASYLDHCSDLITTGTTECRRLSWINQSFPFGTITFTFQSTHYDRLTGCIADKTFSHLMYVRTTLHSLHLTAVSTKHLSVNEREKNIFNFFFIRNWKKKNDSKYNSTHTRWDCDFIRREQSHIFLFDLFKCETYVCLF